MIKTKSPFKVAPFGGTNALIADTTEGRVAIRIEPVAVQHGGTGSVIIGAEVYGDNDHSFSGGRVRFRHYYSIEIPSATADDEETIRFACVTVLRCVGVDVVRFPIEPLRELLDKQRIPACAASMGCLCAGHARGNDADAACDTRES